MIPLCSPKANYLAHKAEIDEAINRVLNSGSYILGDEVQSFEEEFANYLGVAGCVGVACGTDAVELALRVLGVGFGDFVITVSHTSIATAAAITRTGANPLFVDINPSSFTMDPQSLSDLLERYYSEKIKAIVVVHMYGQVADMQSIMAIGDKYGLPVIEDCAQAVGSKIGGKKAGALGKMACFSFYPTKNLGALGDGGALALPSQDLIDKALSLRQYGWNSSRESLEEGINSRLDEIQAAILRVKLRYLDLENEKRRVIASRYIKVLEGKPLSVSTPREGVEHSYHQFVIRLKEREKLCKYLTDHKISFGIHYPLGVHMQRPYKKRSFCLVALPNTEKVVSEILSLPMYPELTKKEQDIICNALVEFFEDA